MKYRIRQTGPNYFEPQYKLVFGWRPFGATGYRTFDQALYVIREAQEAERRSKDLPKTVWESE